jgi:acyl carrier protein
MSTLEQEVIAVVASVLKQPAGCLDRDSGMGVTEGWDSLVMMEIVMAVEKQYAIQFDPEVLYDMVFVRDVVAALQALGF